MTLAISVEHFMLFSQVGIIYKCIVSSVCLVVITFEVWFCFIIKLLQYDTRRLIPKTVPFTIATQLGYSIKLFGLV
jgi:hypothetical protein